MNKQTIWRRQLSPLPTCAGGCDEDLPVVASDVCDPLVIESEIRRIFVAKRTATPFTNWQDAGEWQTRLDDTSTDDDAIRTLWCIADKPAPGQTTKDISNRRKKILGKNHVLNFTIDDVQPEIHDLCRALECGGYYKIWYETHGGLILGGNTGIVVFLKLDMVLGRGADEHMVYSGTAEWFAKFTEERADSPIFQYGTAQTANYDAVVNFVASASPAALNGITAVAAATDAQLKFAYQIISPRVGSDLTMVIKLGATTEITVTFKSDYLGTAFKYVDTTGAVHYGNFASGNVVF